MDDFEVIGEIEKSPNEKSKDVTKILDYIVNLHFEHVGEMNLPFKPTRKNPRTDEQLKNLHSIVDDIWDELKWSLTVDLKTDPIRNLNAQKQRSLKLAMDQGSLDYDFLTRFVSGRWDAFSKKRAKPRTLKRSKAPDTTETTKSPKMPKRTNTTKTCKTTKAAKPEETTKEPRKAS
jgi:hypothetical protein